MEHPTHHHEARMVSASGEDANTKPRPEAEATPTKEQLLATQAEQTQRLQQLQAEFTAATEAGDTDKLRTIAAQAQELQAHLQAHQTAIETYKSPEQLQAEAEADLTTFTDYLKNQGLNEADIQARLGELEIYYDQATNQAMIARADHQPFELALDNLGLTGELPLPKQLLIDQLNCRNNQLTSLPELPPNLQWLDCHYNQLTNLPELPLSLQWLDCHSNQLTNLSELPPSLEELDCYSNQLTSLPKLPRSLQRLHCRFNQLTDSAKLSIVAQQRKIGFRIDD